MQEDKSCKWPQLDFPYLYLYEFYGKAGFILFFEKTILKLFWGGGQGCITCLKMAENCAIVFVNYSQKELQKKKKSFKAHIILQLWVAHPYASYLEDKVVWCAIVPGCHKESDTT